MKIEKLDRSSYKERQDLMLVYGETGVGKSFACIENQKGKDFVVINLENRLHHLTYWFDIPVLSIENFKDFSQLMASGYLIENKNVIIDSISSFYDLLIAHYADKNKEVDLTYKDWGAISRRLSELILFCKNNGKKDVLMTARLKKDKISNKVIERPDIKQEVPFKYVSTQVRIYYAKNSDRTFEIEKDVIIPYGTKFHSLLTLNKLRKLEYKKLSENKNVSTNDQRK